MYDGTFKTGDVASMMGLNPKTITNWVDRDEVNEFFSERARRSDEQSTHRYYNHDDIMVLNTIRLRKTRQNSWQEVADLLRSGHRDTELPASAALTATISPADQFTQVTRIKAEYDALMAQYQDMQAELEDMRQQLVELPKQIRDEYSQHISERDRTIGRLEAKLEIAQEEIERLRKQDDTD